MRKVIVFTVFMSLIVLCAGFSAVEPIKRIDCNPVVSDDLDSILEREMLSNIEYVEEEEEVNLGFDSYFHLPVGFNPYEGMSFSIDEIEYIEIED